MNMPACTLFNEQKEGPNLLSISKWSVLGKQNVQEKKVYSNQVGDPNVSEGNPRATYTDVQQVLTWFSTWVNSTQLASSQTSTWANAETA